MSRDEALRLAAAALQGILANDTDSISLQNDPDYIGSHAASCAVATIEEIDRILALENDGFQPCPRCKMRTTGGPLCYECLVEEKAQR